MGKNQNAFIVITGLITLLSYQLAYAQPMPSVDRATREADRPIREEVSEKLEAPPQKRPEIKEVEKVIPKGPKFFVKKIDLVGTESFPPEDFRSILEKYEGREVALNELSVPAGEIEREYLRRGIIAACFIPPQDIVDGVVVMRVVEARMGSLEIRQDNDLMSTRRISDYWTIERGEILKYDEISRDLYEMNKNPDRDVKVTLHAGKEAGTTDVLLRSKAHFPIHLTGSIDNEGAVTTGKERFGLGIRHNDFLFVDDTLILGRTFGRDFSSNYIYHSIPITEIGTSLMYGYNDSIAIPQKEFSVFGIKTYTQNYSAYIHQDLFDKGDYLGEIQFGFDAKDKVTRMQIVGTSNRDRLRIIRAGGTLIHRHPGCITYFTPQISQGLNGFGAKRKGRLTSRAAENTFTKFNMSVRHARALPLNLQANVNFSMQVASERLVPQEEFFLGGISSVRGYTSGEFLADNAFQTNVELLIPSFWIPEDWKLPLDDKPVKDLVTGVVFFDQGYGEKRNFFDTEKPRASLASFGAGLRIRLYDQLLLRLEWGFPVGDRAITEACDSRFHFSLSFEDQFHREIERIRKSMREKKIDRLAQKILDDELKRPDSPARKQIDSDLEQARIFEEKGEPMKAAACRAKVEKMKSALYSQVRMYVEECQKQRETMKKYSKLASKYYRKGQLEKARNLWDQIEEGSKIRPLVLEYYQ